MRFSFKRKLVRDGIVPVIQAQGGKILMRQLTGEDFRLALLDKLVEEAMEVRIAKTRENRIEELGDLCEVLRAVQLAFIIPPAEIEAARRSKFTKFGGFSKGIKVLMAIGGKRA